MPNETGSQTDTQDKSRANEGGGEGQGGGDADLDPKLSAGVNKLFTSRFAREIKKLEGNIGKLMADQLVAAGLVKPPKAADEGEETTDETQTVARVQAKPAKGAEGKGKGQERDDTDAGKGVPGAPSLEELEAIRADLAKQKREVEKIKRETAEKERLATEREAFSEVKSRLTGKVRQEALDTVMKLLRADGRIAIEKDGSVLFVDGEDRLDLDEGLEQWLKSSEGSMFVPAPGGGRQINQGGSGRRPPAKPVPRVGNAGGNLTPAQRAAQRMAKLGLSP